MAETEVKEVSIDTLEMPEFKKARANGQTTVEVKTEENEDTKDEVAFETETKPEEKPEEKKEEKKVSGGWQRRLDKEVKAKAAVAEEAARQRERADRLERQLQERSAKQSVQEDSKTANPERFIDWEDWQAQQTAAGKPAKHQDWLDARDEWRERKEEKITQEQQARELDKQFKDRVSKLESEVENFDEVFSAAEGIEIPQAAADALKEMDNGEKVWFFLIQNPEVCTELMAMNKKGNERAIRDAVWRMSGYLYAGEAKQAKEAEKNEEDEEEVVVKKQAEEKPKAKFAPIKPVSGGSTKSSKPLDQMSQAEFNKARAAGRTS